MRKKRGWVQQKYKGVVAEYFRKLAFRHSLFTNKINSDATIYKMVGYLKMSNNIAYIMNFYKVYDMLVKTYPYKYKYININ